MSTSSSFARSLRLRRLQHHGGRYMIVPLDHSISDGPLGLSHSLDECVRRLAANEVDAVVLHKGAVRHVSPEHFARTSLILHLSASTGRARDPDAKYLVSSVEEAVRLGADAVSVHTNLGSDTEARQVADLATVADACDRWGMPLLAMVYPRGPRIEDARDPDLVAHAVTLATDLGADIVKTVYPGSVEVMDEIARSCPIPIVVAGGALRPAFVDVLAYVAEAMEGGAAGVAVGRNVFTAPDPGTAARQIADIVHADVPRDRVPRLKQPVTAGP